MIEIKEEEEETESEDVAIKIKKTVKFKDEQLEFAD